ncbi:MAG: prepilin peptidase [Candidatus Methanofastidiosia archaeon]|jgi:preflagellin peptidase FlaK
MIVLPAVTIGFLLYGSYKDITVREVPDTLWVVMGCTGIMFRVIDHQWMLMGISVIIAFLLGMVLAVSGMFGGADIKALLALSLLIPQYPGIIAPFFVITIFNNLAVIRIFEMGVIFFYNIIKAHRFEGEIPLWKKILLYTTGFPRSVKDIDYRFLPLQTSTGDLQLMPDIDMDIETFKAESTADIVWVTYGSPLILYMLIGCIIAFVRGDLILELLLHVIG